jgi:transposase-like protein
MEMEYQKPIREVILEMLNSGATMTATADRLGVNKQALYAWLDKLEIKKKVVWG